MVLLAVNSECITLLDKARIESQMYHCIFTIVFLYFYVVQNRLNTRDAAVSFLAFVYLPSDDRIDEKCKKKLDLSIDRKTPINARYYHSN